MSSTAHTRHAQNCAVGTESLVSGPVLVVDFLLNTVSYKQACS